jgi:thiamine biosynthesis lipoprotein
MQIIKLARNAMATRFEIVLHGENPIALRAAGEEALDEIDRLEAQLSLYCPTSEISHLNARAAREPVRVTPPLFSLLKQAQQLHRETEGAFDITIAPLVRCWGFMGGTGQMPTPEQVLEARAHTGMKHIILNEENFSVRFAQEGVMIDLGAIGKGYAVERAAELLRESGVNSALLHGGTSTVYALGKPFDAETWTIAVENAPAANNEVKSSPESLLATIPLRDEALSVSAVWGRAFQANGKTFGHVLDPRSGEPVSNAVLAAVVLPSATETDALSTALLVRGIDGQEKIQTLRPAMRTLVVTPHGNTFQVRAQGIALHSFGKMV